MMQAICWVLIHSLWQGVLLALAGGGVILCTKRAAPAERYQLLCWLAGIFLVGIGGTFLYEWRLAAESGDGIGAIGVSMNWLADWCAAHAFQVVTVWLTVAIIKSVRMAAGLAYFRRMRREGLAAPALLVERVGLLSRQLGIPRAVKLVESAVVRVPMVIGHLRPIIFIPLGLINHLPASEMEAVLLHELAHIRRYDHLVNMVQQAAECLLFFNPGFLWISSLIREERENCCDDMAIAYTQDRVEFVRALVRFKEHSMRRMALAFPGNRRQLLHRVLRISRQENKTLSGRERLLLLGGCLAILCLLVARADVRKKAEPAAETRLAVVRLAQEQLAQTSPVTVVSRETMAVLQERERVSQNMAWVKAQLDRLRKPAVKKITNNLEQEAIDAERDRQQALDRDLIAERAAESDRQKVAEQYLNQKAAQEEQEANRAEAEQDKVQAEKDREQGEQDRKQAELDRQQADRDRQQADRDRLQAELDRLQAEKDRKQAELDRQQADKNREQAVLERLEAEQNRKQVERPQDERATQRVARDQQKSKNNQQKSKNN